MKVIILGANGQLGRGLAEILRNKVNFKLYRKKDIDITDFISVERMIKDEKPEILINTAAYTSVDAAENNANYAYKVNSEAVKNIAKLLESYNGYLIHYSTDYVYDGEKKTPYRETDETLPLNIYGKSKLEGDINIQEYMTNFLILRTSWVFSYYGNNYIKTILKLIKNKEILNVVEDQYGVPTSTNLLGKVTYKIIQNIKSPYKIDSGVYNVTPKGITNWYEMANKIFEKVNVKDSIPELNKVKILPINSINYPYEAKRPKNSLLNSSKIEKALNIQLPHWESEFNEIIDKILEGYYEKS